MILVDTTNYDAELSETCILQICTVLLLDSFKVDKQFIEYPGESVQGPVIAALETRCRHRGSVVRGFSHRKIH